MESVLLKKAQTDHSCDFQSQLLIVRKNIASDQLYDFHQRAFLVKDRHDLISVCDKFLGTHGCGTRGRDPPDTRCSW